MSFLKITDPEKRDFLVKEFLMSKHNIRQNSLSEKLGDIGLQRELTKIYKPITDSQTTLKEATERAASNTSTALKALSASLSSQMIQFPQYPSIQAEDDEVPKESLIELGPIATEYLRSMASKTLTDKTFGLHDKNGAFYIGDSEVTIFGDNILVGETEFNGTPGLWELITSKNPDSEIYTLQDIDSYKTILLKTNAIVNPETGKVRSSSSDKYKNIIKPIYDEYLKPKKTTKQFSPSLRQVPATAPLLTQKKGKGITLRQSPASSMLMPSDPNALIEMVALRVASYKAGNTGVRNEIVDISDELLRQDIIDKASYKKLMLQL